MIRSATAVSVCVFSAVSLCRGDYLDDTGYRELAAELGTALPTGQGVTVTQVETALTVAGGATAYLPEEGSGTFTGAGYFMRGVALTAKSGPSGISGHSLDVAAHFYGRNQDPNTGRSTFTPGVTAADVYRVGEDDGSDANSWLGEAFLAPGSAPPLTESRAVQNHSWISIGTLISSGSDKNLLRRLDFAVQRDGFLTVTGVNNGQDTTVPALMASAYNNLAVGVTSGNHSRGGVPMVLDGGGRQKPEIVAPMDYTSFSTALVSSAGAFLRQTADTQGPNARKPQTLKAILLAGATKEEFPGWSRTATVPLDRIYGAGELHLGHSWHILAGGEQAANATTPVPDKAWSSATLTTATTADYRLTIPPGEIGEVLSVMAVWPRIITDSNPGSGFTASVAALADYNLLLQRVPATGSVVTVDQSLSTIENLEHLYQRNLPSGTWRLRLNLAGGGHNVPVAVAWRLHRVPHRPGISLQHADGQDTLTFTGLVTGQRYLVQNSGTLDTWTTVNDFTADGGSFTWSVPPTAGRWFYRLAAADAGAVLPPG
ncbi:MAG: hypothetical protein V4726_12930 [Verrucomicrobiota bacterium]